MSDQRLFRLPTREEFLRLTIRLGESYEDYCQRLAEGMVEVPEPTLLEELQETKAEAERLGNAARDAANQRTREIVEVIRQFAGKPVTYPARRIHDIADKIAEDLYPEAFEQTED